MTMRLLVLGDFIQDLYTFCRATRICPEAPVPVIVRESSRNSDGGAGLVYGQLKELGADVEFRYGSWSHKERIFAGNHLICRIDRDGYLNELENFDPARFDAFVIADYGKGAMTPALAHQIVETDLPCFVDAKHHWHWYSGRNVTIFPNEHECLDETFRAHQVVRKLGKNGCEHFNLHLPAAATEVVDVTGAGDIFMAGFVYTWALDFKPESCLRFANAIAGESCRHVGTYVVPRAFAQAYLDRLRASEAPGQQALDRLSGSNELVHPPRPQSDRSSEVPSALESVHSLLEGSMQAAIDSLNLPGSPQRAQTRPISPSDPTQSNVSHTLADRENVDESGRKLRTESPSQNPTESERQRANILMRDLD
jgi:bifunctional ADP-heptose synthase (sugar kinase/adenylyltransferase)